MKDEAPAPPRPWRMSTATWVVRVLGVTLLLLVGIWAGWRMHLTARINEMVEAIRAAGYPMSPAELEAWYPYPEGPNAADVLEEAFRRYREVELPDDGETVPIIGSADLPEPGMPLPEAARESLLMAVEANRDAIERLHEAAAIPESRFPIDLTTPTFLIGFPPHLDQLAFGARLLHADTLLALEAGDSDRASRNVTSLLRLSQTLSEEPTYVFMLMAIRLRAIAFDSMQHVLSRGDIAPEAIEETATHWDEAGVSRRFSRVLATERAAWAMTGTVYAGGDELTSSLGAYFMKISGMRRLDLLLYVETMTQFIDIVEREPVETWTNKMKKVSGDWLDLPWYAAHCAVILPSTPVYAITLMQDVAQGRIVRLAAAVERFRQEHGRTPAKRAELEADGVVIPLDPMDGLPLRYRPLEHGYLIYSVGRNGIDDGGVPRRTDSADDMRFHVQRLRLEATPDDAGEEDAG